MWLWIVTKHQKRSTVPGERKLMEDGPDEFLLSRDAGRNFFRNAAELSHWTPRQALTRLIGVWYSISLSRGKGERALEAFSTASLSGFAPVNTQPQIPDVILTMLLTASCTAQLQNVPEKREYLVRKNVFDQLLCHSLCLHRKREGLSCCWEQWHRGVASARVDLFLRLCESLRSPLRSLWGLKTAQQDESVLCRISNNKANVLSSDIKLQAALFVI